jgi:hypothetical protein
MKKILFLFLLCALAGCNPAAKLSIVEAGKPSLVSLTSLGGRLVVENSSRREITVEEARLVMRFEERELASARLTEPLVAAARAISEVEYEFALDNISISGLMSLQNRLANSPEEILVDASAWISRGGSRRKIEMKGVPASRFIEFLSNFDPS